MRANERCGLAARPAHKAASARSEWKLGRSLWRSLESAFASSSSSSSSSLFEVRDSRFVIESGPDLAADHLRHQQVLERIGEQSRADDKSPGGRTRCFELPARGICLFCGHAQVRSAEFNERSESSSERSRCQAQALEDARRAQRRGRRRYFLIELAFRLAPSEPSEPLGHSAARERHAS